MARQTTITCDDCGAEVERLSNGWRIDVQPDRGGVCGPAYIAVSISAKYFWGLGVDGQPQDYCRECFAKLTVRVGNVALKWLRKQRKGEVPDVDSSAPDMCS